MADARASKALTSNLEGHTLVPQFYQGPAMATRMTVKGQVTLPKAVRDAGIRPGDRVTVRALPEGGVVVERESAPDETTAFLACLEEIAERKPMKDGPFGANTTDEIMKALRGED